MGQVFVVQAATQDVADHYFAMGLAAFVRVVGIRPIAQWQGNGVAVAKFPKKLSASAGISFDEKTGRFICGAGSWLYGTLSGEKAQQKLLSELDTSAYMADSTLQHIDGPFVFITADTSKNELTVTTDRTGTLHVYHSHVGGALLICTSSLILAALTRPAWDLVSCREFLATGTVFEERTLFTSVTKFPPASVTTFASGKPVSTRKYWKVCDHVYDAAVERNGVKEWADALEDSVIRISKAYQSPVFDLTGGLDSRAVLGAALRAKVPIHSVVNGDPNHPDVVIANRIARTFRLRHRHQATRVDQGSAWACALSALPFCDGEYDLIEYARTLDHQSRLAGIFSASVNGSGGEIGKGYWWELLYPVISRRDNFNERRVAARRFAVNAGGAALVQGPIPDMVEHFAQVIHRANTGFEGLPNTAKMDNVYLTLRMQRWQGRIASATTRVWDCFSPFLFRRPMEVALSTAPSRRVRNRMSRRLITTFSRDLAAIPVPEGGPALPLTPATAHLFWPLAWSMGEKAFARWRRSASKPVQTGHANQHGSNLPVLDPSTMASAELFDQHRLNDFLRAANSLTAELRRIISLEVLARSING